MTMISGYEWTGSDEVFEHECDLCKDESITAEAISFCTTCREYLCRSCDKAHRGSRASKDHTLLTGSKIPSGSKEMDPNVQLMMCDIHKNTVLHAYCNTHDNVICTTCKMTNHTTCDTVHLSFHTARANLADPLKTVCKTLADVVSTCETLKVARQVIKSNSEETGVYNTIADDIVRQIGVERKYLDDCKKSGNNDAIFVGIKKTSLRAEEIGNTLADLLHNLAPLEAAIVDKHSVENRVLNMSFVDKKEIDVGTRIVYGCTFMSNGQLVLACGDEGIKRFKNFKFLSHCSRLALYSLDVSAINDTDVVVTQGKYNQLLFVRVLPDMMVKKTLNVGRKCWGVDVYDGEIYVTCHDNTGNSEIQVLNMDGKLLRRLVVILGINMVTPSRVRVSKDGSKLFVSDWDTNMVTCLSTHGHVVYQYSDKDLRNPFGLYVDDTDNVLVCGVGSHNVQLIRNDGRKDRTVLSKKDGLDNPLCIAYRHSDGCLVVVLNEVARTNKKLISFKTK